MELSSPKNFPNSKIKSINYEKHSYILGNKLSCHKPIRLRK